MGYFSRSRNLFWSFLFVIYVNELTTNKIASLILGVLDAEMCRAKYKYKYIERKINVKERYNFLLLYLYYRCKQTKM